MNESVPVKDLFGFFLNPLCFLMFLLMYNTYSKECTFNYIAQRDFTKLHIARILNHLLS